MSLPLTLFYVHHHSSCCFQTSCTYVCNFVCLVLELYSYQPFRLLRSWLYSALNVLWCYVNKLCLNQDITLCASSFCQKPYQISVFFRVLLLLFFFQFPSNGKRFMPRTKTNQKKTFTRDLMNYLDMTVRRWLWGKMWSV